MKAEYAQAEYWRLEQVLAEERTALATAEAARDDAKATGKRQRFNRESRNVEWYASQVSRIEVELAIAGDALRSAQRAHASAELEKLTDQIRDVQRSTLQADIERYRKLLSELTTAVADTEEHTAIEADRFEQAEQLARVAGVTLDIRPLTLQERQTAIRLVLADTFGLSALAAWLNPLAAPRWDSGDKESAHVRSVLQRLNQLAQDDKAAE